MASITETFPSAPRGRRVYLSMLVAAGAGLAGVVASLAITLTPHPGHLQSKQIVAILLAPALTILVAIPTFLVERTKTAQFRIEDDVLVLAKKRYPLAGATEVIRDPEVLKGACKVWGNGGLGAVRGRYRSKRIGRFEAFLTDPDRAVVVRWPDRTVAVSPADPEFFIYSARKAAGLK